VPAIEIAFMQDYKKTEAKQRLFGDVRAGKVRFLIGSSETMGTGVNAQLRLKALHHLDVPWLPSQIEQREGRIVRQGNQHDEVDIFAYATEGSLDASMWQNNERKARFIAAALSGDTSIRRLEDSARARPTSSPWPRRSRPATSA
jgi:SNF2 family DNA or RNA helicase